MQRRYCSGVLSLSHVVSMVLWVVAVALPLLLALGSRVNSYREQPVVAFKDEVLCILEGEQEGERPLTLVHSTFPERVQQLYSNESLQAAFVKTSSTDVNEDGIAESVRVEIATPLSTNEIIRQATVVVVLDYTLKSYAKLNMDVLTVFRHSSLFAGDTLYVDGDLDLHQRSALEITDSMQQPYIDSPIVNMTNANTTQELLVQSLISGYRERNYTANFHAPYPIWTPNSNSSEDIRVFRVLMDIRIDTVNVFTVVQVHLTMSTKASEHKTQEEVDLDDLLDDALDDFADEVSASEMSSVTKEAAATTAATQDSEDNKLQENMAKFLEDAQNPEFQKVLEQAFRELGTDADAENIEQLLGSLKTDETDDVNAGVAKTLQNMAKAAEDMEGVGTAQVEAMGEEMMSEMMKKFEEMGEKSDFQDLVDGMMQQLLSKDVMYDPMKQICERYPEWLAEKESLLSKEDYERYGKQYQYFQQIVAVYESEPDNYTRLSELMQEMQETGQPPSEIVKDLAPGLQFDDEGMPIMPNMGPGMFPGMAGMPLGGAPGQEQCSVM
ncbi:hypothetical protein JG688_00001598 [Phytophthora aleatoria]|uniref:Transmembrane protein n=1 Tax=Phytophthora aleatoria TaxID=2496075 RepID=A0A8J5IXJ4_9STRA|nr:hypothetical protein JG688_00001598 [Phytophthora aleatoria]